MKILDACCGSKMFWYEKHEPHTTYIDIRNLTKEVKDRDHIRKVEVAPDMIADFRKMPFKSCQFGLVIFDPPHLLRAGKTSWLAAKYGVLNKDTWEEDLKAGFKECMRVLEWGGILLFKWSNVQIPHSKVMKLFDKKPILGDKRGKTRWSVFIKAGREELWNTLPEFSWEYLKEHEND